MFLQRIQKHLKAIFILSLVFTQGLVFVASKAASNDEYNLSATFIEPILGQNIEIGQELTLEAQLSLEDQADFSQVFFTLRSLDFVNSLNFQAQQINNGNYIADNTWDTSDWDSGVYQVYATAHVYDEDGLLEDSYQSEPGFVNLYRNDFEMAAEVQPIVSEGVDWINPSTDIAFPPGQVIEGDTIDFQLTTSNENLNMSGSVVTVFPYGNINEEFQLLQLNVVAQEGGVWSTGPIDVSDLADAPYTAIFESYIAVPGGGDDGDGDNSSTDSLPISSSVSFTLDRETTIALPDFQLLSPGQNNPRISGDLDIQVALPEASGTFMMIVAYFNQIHGGYPLQPDEQQEYGGYSTYSTTIDTTNGDYPDGEYLLRFVARIDDRDNPIGPMVMVTIDNEPDEVPIDEPDYTIYLDSPESTQVVPRNFLVNFHTGFEASEVTLNLTSEDGLFTEGNSFNVPGTTWTWHPILDDTWPAGVSTLNILATHASGTVVEQDFPINIESIDPPIVIDPGDVTLNLLQGTQSISGPVNIKALANYSDLVVEFFAIDTQTQEQVWSGVGGEVNQQYVALLDTANFENLHNYEINARTEVEGTMIFAPNPYTIQFVGDDGNGQQDNEFFFDIIDNYAHSQNGRNLTFPIISGRDFGFTVDFELMDSEGDIIPETEIDISQVASIVNEDWSNLERTGINVEDFRDDYYPGKLTVTLSHEDFDNFPDGDYSLKVNVLNTEQGVVASDQVAFSVESGRAPEWQDTEEDSMSISIFGGGGGVEIKGLFNIVMISGGGIDEPEGLTFILKNNESGEEFEYFVFRSSWEELLSTGLEGIGETNRTRNIYIKKDVDSTLMPNGIYAVSIIDYPDLVSENFVYNINNPEGSNNNEASAPTGSSSTSSEVVIELYTSCMEVGISDPVACDMFRATMDQVDSSCIEQGIYSVVDCEDYLNRTQVDVECQDAGIVNIGECQDYLLEKYSSNVDCQLSDANRCTELLRGTFLNRLVVGQKKQGAIHEVVDPLIGQNITVLDLNQKLLQKGVGSDVLPLESNSKARVYVAQSDKETVLEDEDKLTILNQAVIILDGDGDGLSDDIEAYYGTDPSEKDTDGDGYDDGTEIKNGYNPNGPGVLEKERTVVDKIILANNPLEQPKVFSKKADKNFVVEEVNNLEESLELRGKAEANSWVLLYLYSDLPLVMTTKTDASGNWSYDIQDSLADGHHQVYVTVNDETGKIVKQSKPISFLVKSAQAVTAEDYFDTSEVPDSIKSMTMYYILGATLLVLLALGVIIFIHSRKNGTDIGSEEDGQI